MNLVLDNMSLQEDTNQFPFLSLPNEIKFKIYSYFDLASRRALRVNETLEEIEMETKYRHETMEITMEETIVHLSYDGAEIEISHSEVEDELELIGKNTQFNQIHYKSIRSGSRGSVNATRFIKAKKITFDDPNKEEVIIKDSCIDGSGYMWIYEAHESNEVDHRYNFMIKLGYFDMDDNEFYATNPNQEVTNGDDVIHITEGCLGMVIYGLDADPYEWDSESECFGPLFEESRESGFVSFEILEEEKKG